MGARVLINETRYKGSNASAPCVSANIAVINAKSIFWIFDLIHLLVIAYFRLHLRPLEQQIARMERVAG